MKNNKRDEIIRATSALLDSQGYRGFGLSDILAAAGINKGTFYYYFSSKDDVVRQCIALHTAETLKMLRSFPTDIDGLRHFFSAVFSGILQSGFRESFGYSSVMYIPSLHDSSLRGESGILSAHIEDFIRKALASSFDFSDKLASEYAGLIFMTFQGALLRTRAEGSAQPWRIFDRFIFEMLLRREIRSHPKREPALAE